MFLELEFDPVKDSAIMLIYSFAWSEKAIFAAWNEKEMPHKLICYTGKIKW